MTLHVSVLTNSRDAGWRDPRDLTRPAHDICRVSKWKTLDTQPKTHGHLFVTARTLQRSQPVRGKPSQASRRRSRSLPDRPSILCGSGEAALGLAASASAQYQADLCHYHHPIGPRVRLPLAGASRPSPAPIRTASQCLRRFCASRTLFDASHPNSNRSGSSVLTAASTISQPACCGSVALNGPAIARSRCSGLCGASIASSAG